MAKQQKYSTGNNISQKDLALLYQLQFYMALRNA